MYLEWLRGLPEGTRATIIHPAGRDLLASSANGFDGSAYRCFGVLRDNILFTRDGMMMYLTHLVQHGYVGAGAKGAQEFYSDSGIHSFANMFVIMHKLETLRMVMGCPQPDLCEALVTLMPSPNVSKATVDAVNKLEKKSGTQKQQLAGTSYNLNTGYSHDEMDYIMQFLAQKERYDGSRLDLGDAFTHSNIMGTATAVNAALLTRAQNFVNFRVVEVFVKWVTKRHGGQGRKANGEPMIQRMPVLLMCIS